MAGSGHVRDETGYHAMQAWPRQGRFIHAAAMDFLSRKGGGVNEHHTIIITIVFAVVMLGIFFLVYQFFGV